MHSSDSDLSLTKVLACLPLESYELRNKINLGVRTLHDFSAKRGGRMQTKNFLKHWLNNHMYDPEIGGPTIAAIFGNDDNEATSYATACQNFITPPEAAQNVWCAWCCISWRKYETLKSALSTETAKEPGESDNVNITRARVARRILLDDLNEAISINSMRQRTCICFVSFGVLILMLVATFGTIYGSVRAGSNN